jgi:hypothetical protein
MLYNLRFSVNIFQPWLSCYTHSRLAMRQRTKYLFAPIITKQCFLRCLRFCLILGVSLLLTQIIVELLQPDNHNQHVLMAKRHSEKSTQSTDLKSHHLPHHTCQHEKYYLTDAIVLIYWPIRAQGKPLPLLTASAS